MRGCVWRYAGGLSAWCSKGHSRAGREARGGFDCHRLACTKLVQKFWRVIREFPLQRHGTANRDVFGSGRAGLKRVMPGAAWPCWWFEDRRWDLGWPWAEGDV